MTLLGSIADLLTAGTVASSSHDTKFVTLQVTGETDGDRDEYELHGPDGYAYRPKAGAECLIITSGADPDQAVVIYAVQRSKVPGGLKEGERVLYNADGKVMVRLDPDDPDVVNLAEATNPLGLGDRMDAELDRIWTAIGQIKGHTHPLSTGTSSASTELNAMNTSKSGSVEAQHVKGS